MPRSSPLHGPNGVERVAAALGASQRIELPAAGLARAAAMIVTSVEGAELHLPDLIARAGVISILNAQPDMTVVAEAVNGEQAIMAYREKKPDVALIDEADSVLIDEARVPLVLAGATEIADVEHCLESLAERTPEPLRANGGVISTLRVG